MAALLNRRLPLGLYAPRQVKLTLTGYGNADKEQVAKMVALVLNLRAESCAWMKATPWPWPIAMG